VPLPKYTSGKQAVEMIIMALLEDLESESFPDGVYNRQRRPVFSNSVIRKIVIENEIQGFGHCNNRLLSHFQPVKLSHKLLPNYLISRKFYITARM
jgi:hypothetical protein